MADPDKAVKPYPDNVWLLKRLGLTWLAFVVALVLAAIADTADAPGPVVAVLFWGALLGFFAVGGWWFVQATRRENRRKAAIRALHRGEPIDQPALKADLDTGQPGRSPSMWVALAVSVCGIPLIVVGAAAHVVALRDIGLVLIVIWLVVIAIVLPRATAKRQLRRTTGNPT